MKARMLFQTLGFGLALSASGVMLVSAQDSSAQSQQKKQQATHTTQSSDDAERNEGQKRFQQNCGRCHHAPEALSPRVTPAVLMHMRVRANLTAEDQRLILKFMAQ